MPAVGHRDKITIFLITANLFTHLVAEPVFSYPISAKTLP